MSILIKDAWIVTQNSNRDILQGDVYIKGNRISAIGSLSQDADITINAKGKILIPGLINTHTHIAMSPLRGKTDDIPLNKFLDITSKFDKGRSSYEIYKSALQGSIEAIRLGTTTIVDLYYSEDIIEKAVNAAGLRALLAWVILDKALTTQEGIPIENAETFAKSKGAGIATHTIGFQGIYAANEDLLSEGMSFARKNSLVVPMHLSESEFEVKECIRKNHMPPVEYLGNIGFLCSNLLAVHAVWLSSNEAKLFSEFGVNVSHNPTSNMKLGNGISDIASFVEQGINVTLGTDSVSTNNSLDMFQEMKFAALLQKGKRLNPTTLSAQEILDFVTINAAYSIGMENELGSIENGKLADVVLIDPKPNALPLHKQNIISNIVYSVEGLNVDTSIIDGRLVLLHKRYLGTAKEKD